MKPSTLVKRRGLALALTCSVASAQVHIPSLPPGAAPVPPATTPSTPAPAPGTPPPAPAAPPAPKPQPPQPTKPQLSRAPLLVQVKASLPALVGGRKTTVPQLYTYTISAERALQLRQRGQVTESLQKDLDAFLRLLATPKDARFEQLDDGQWVVLQRNGLEVDAAAARTALNQALRGGQAALVTLSASRQTRPERTLDFFAQRGITTFLATGFTSYSGSSPERVKNIHVGAQNFKDRLFEGSTFSFNKWIGPISQRNGYVPGLVIAGDQTASGVGGGICQVSTTVFRTLYGAGLKILQRQNHSYQVFYYDPQGLDATIYQPQLDLKFANTTGGAIWFQTEWNDEEATLAITAFGKARDFQVFVDEPRTVSTTPAPKDRLIYDPSLPAGQRKQVDWAAPGATTEVTRRFVRAGKTFEQDTLRSVYRPWPNIFRVGTKKG